MNIATIPRGFFIFLTLTWLAFVAFLLAHLTSLFVAEAIGAKVDTTQPIIPSPAGTTSASPQELGKLILQSKIFPGDQHVSVLDNTSKELKRDSSLQLAMKLVGTIVGTNDSSYAILQSSQSSHQTLYQLGDLIPHVGNVIRIDRHQVVIALLDGRQATVEAVWWEKTESQASSKILTQAPSNYQEIRKVMQRREIVEAFSNLPHLLQQAKATPIISGTGMDGVSFENIQATSIFDRLGFQVGDELKAINGVPLRDPGTLLIALRQIQHESDVTLDVVRKHQNMTMRYDIQ